MKVGSGSRKNLIKGANNEETQTYCTGMHFSPDDGGMRRQRQPKRRPVSGARANR
jgi:hypothetical protein